MNLKHILLNDILPRVEKPSQYLGNEWNSVVKDPGAVDLRVCLFFPDLYELGLGNLGLHILYAILNDLPWLWAERAYTPAPDMEAVLRGRKLPLFMHESKDPVAAADLIGFTLQSELTYTNLLNAIDLAGLPLHSAERGDGDPLLFAGGPGAYNPEPLAPFLDFFVIGDGEEAILEVVEALRPLKNAPRQERLRAVAGIDGVYVPEFCPVEETPDGRLLPKENAPKIVRRLVRDLDKARFPARCIVPFTQLVHDGVGIEVLRGCTHGCRFCQAGMVTRPVRERSLERVDALIEEALAHTGLENVSLVSLSTCDYSRARSLVRQSAERAHRGGASVSLPSLRLDSFSIALADLVSGVRRSGLTFAPEAGTPRMRAVINKPVEDELFLEMAAEACRRGWTHVKAYFMIGLPTETDEDVLAIADLCIRTLERCRRVHSRALLRLGVSTFVPKPFTPFQWARQIDYDETVRKQALLHGALKRHGGIKFGRHLPAASFIEGLIARGDRRTAELIESAWRHGARLESCDEHVRLELWHKAIEETGYDAAAQFRERDPEERLPWDHIDALVPKEWLREEGRRASALEYTQDCRAGRCNHCGVIERVPGLCREMLEAQCKARAEEAPTGAAQAPARQPHTEREPIQRIRFRIGRTGEARLLSHLEMQNAWIRALRRARAPLAHSKGFHAHPKVTFATAAPLGEESEGDYMDVVLDQFTHPDELLARLQPALPRDFRAFNAADVPLRGPSLMSLVSGFAYTLYTEGNREALEERIRELMARREVRVERRAKASREGKGKDYREIVTLDVRPMIQSVGLRETQGPTLELDFVTAQEENRLAKPKDIIHLLGLDPCQTRVLKRATYLENVMR